MKWDRTRHNEMRWKMTTWIKCNQTKWNEIEQDKMRWDEKRQHESNKKDKMKWDGTR